MINDIKEQMKDRLRDSFVFAFAVSAVHWNWRFLYFLWRTPLPPKEAVAQAWQMYEPGWLWASFAIAAGFSFTFPLLQMALTWYRARVNLWTENRVARVQLGKLYELSTIRDNPEYRGRLEDAESLKNFVRTLYHPDAPSVQVNRMAQAQVGFAHHTREGYVASFAAAVTPQGFSGLVYVAERIGSELVLCVSPGDAFRATGERHCLALLRDGGVRPFSGDPKRDDDVIAFLSEHEGGKVRFNARIGINQTDWRP